MISIQSLWFGEGLRHKETCINLSEKAFSLLASHSSPKSLATKMSIAPCPGLSLPLPIWCKDVLKRSTGREPLFKLPALPSMEWVYQRMGSTATVPQLLVSHMRKHGLRTPMYIVFGHYKWLGSGHWAVV